MSRLTKKYADSERYYSTHSCDEVLQKLGKLEDKETPKKPKIDYDDEWDEFGNRMIYEERCPVCNTNLTEVGGAYCHSCGQAIDWS